MPGEVGKSRALLIGPKGMDPELRALLGGYGYAVDYCRTREEGVKRFRERRQSLVIVDADALGGFPQRLFRFFRTVRESAIGLVASGLEKRDEVAKFLLWGAHDVLQFPLRREALNFTLSRTSAYHRMLVRRTFLRNALYFMAVMLPFWLLLLFLVVR